MRMRKKPNLDMRIERCAHLLIPQPETMRGFWLRSKDYDGLHLEIGCGKGRFIAEKAQRHPSIFFVALEKSANVLVAAMELAVREGLQNVCYINALAENLTQFFSHEEVCQIYINFCDPWPSNRHKKRRLVSRGFLEQYWEILAPGGEIHFKTDNPPLFEFSLREFMDSGFAVLEVSNNLHKDGLTGAITEYEKKFYSAGLPIHWCRVQKERNKHEAH